MCVQFSIFVDHMISSDFFRATLPLNTDNLILKHCVKWAVFSYPVTYMFVDQKKFLNRTLAPFQAFVVGS